MSSKVAIIGFQGRFPGGSAAGAGSCGALLSGECVSGPVPADRWSAARFVTRDRAAGKTPTGDGAFLDYDYRGFDPDVFDLPAAEIAALDPQQRLVLEVAWEALERAAIDPTSLAGGAVGVYVGGFTTDHLLNQFSAQGRTALGRFSAAGSTLTMLANRLSYALDLRGPSLTVDTACASSLTALAAAIRDLQTGACRLALAGGVSFMLRPEYQVAMAAAGLLAADGRSKPFSNLADGYGRGEGCGMLVLKRLDDALADDDRVWAVVEAIGTGHGGRSAGISLPNGRAQEALMRHVLAESGLPPGAIGYVEAHGTGTVQGDRIEARSIGAVYGRGGRTGALPIGSVKASIGHLEAASGVASVIRALLILRSGRVPPHRVAGRPDPDIPFAALNLRLPREPEPLGAPRVAVNAFGYGGSTAHVILGLPVPAPAGPASPPPASDGAAVMLPLSAQSGEALATWLARLSEAAGAGLPLADLQYTLARRRGHRRVRTAAWVDRNAAPGVVAAAIRAAGAGEAAAADGHPRTLFVFSGMGTARPGMGRALMEAEPVFRAAVEEIDAAFRPMAGFSLAAALRDGEDALLARGSRIVQPLTFALQVGLIRLLSAYGLDPDLCLGHSAGEVAAAACAGHLTLAQAVAVCWARTTVQERRAGNGGMLTAALGIEEAEALCRAVPGLSVAALNARRSVTLSGTAAALAEAERALAARKVAARRLPVDIAYHSADMDPILPELRARLERLDPPPPARPLLSTVTGRPVSGTGEDRMGAAYWPRNVREPVRFRAALEAALDLGATHCVEIGPGPVLQGAIRRLAQERAQALVVVPALDGGANEARALRGALTRLYAEGGRLDWARLAPAGRACDLPVTGWHRERLWHEVEVQARDRLGQEDASPWAEPGLVARSWIADLNRDAFAFLCDHRVEGVPVLPGAASLEAALRTALAVRAVPEPDRPLRLADIRFERPFPLDRKVGQMLDSRHIDGALDVLAYDPGRPDGAVRVLSARIAEPGPRPEAQAIFRRAGRAPHPLGVEVHYARLAALGMAHGPAFRVLQSLSLAADGTALLARLSVDRTSLADGPVQWGPCLLDGLFQAALALTVGCEALIPVAIRSCTVHAALPESVWAWVGLAEGSDGPLFDASLHDEAGSVLVQLEGIAVRPLAPWRDPARLPDLCLALRWSPAPQDAPPKDAPRTVPRRVSVIAPEGPEAGHIRRALAEAGMEAAAAGPVDATVLLVPGGPRPLAERLGEALGLGTDPSRGRVYLVTRDAQAVRGEDHPVRPGQAAAWGLGRTLFNEIPETCTTLVDVAGDEPWYAALAREIASDRPSSEVALRDGQRWLPRLAALSLAEAAARAPRFDPSRSYLVTGGLGGFGRQLALWLARHGAGHIVLTSRSRPDQASLAPLARELANLGAAVSVETPDLADPASVRALLHRLAAGPAPPTGIFHWAGLTVDRPAAALTPADIRRVLEPKADGARALHLGSLDTPLDWFVMASSLSALVGNPHQANYAAANAYLDGLALARRKAGLPALSVAFGAITGAGMAADPAVAAHLRAAGLPSMSMASALAGLGAALASGLPQVGLCRAIDGERWVRYAPRSAGTDRMADLLAGIRAPDATAGRLRGDLARHPPDRRARIVTDHLRALVAQVLRCSGDRLPAYAVPSRMGLDSLAAVELQVLIDHTFGVPVPMTALIGGQTLAAIAATIARDAA